MSILKAENISKMFDGELIIDHINIELHKGEIVSILGVSGVGKTTLFNILSGLMKPDNGCVYMEDKDVTGVSGNVSYMLQKDLLLSHLKIIDNVSLPLVINGMKKRQAREIVRPLFAQFKLEGCEDKYPCQLSGGMRQRAAFFRTYMSSKGVVLLDEPFSALDTLTKSAMHQWYMDVIKDMDISTIFITHDIDEAIRLSDRIYVLSGKPGKVALTITIDRDMKQDEDFQFSAEYTQYKKSILKAL
ncbi:MAG: ABC transporter ATP-binding protein [Lachnospiraceae bacterium]|nr:ABC transporter ATP-binding protein [Lachnospiraceae bacterium]